MSFQQLALFILICHGMTQILMYGKIFDRIRPDWKFFKCSLCLSFHVGIIVYLLSLRTELFNFETSPILAFFLGCLSSGTCYFLDKIVGDEGLRISKQ